MGVRNDAWLTPLVCPSVGVVCVDGSTDGGGVANPCASKQQSHKICMKIGISYGNFRLGSGSKICILGPENFPTCRSRDHIKIMDSFVVAIYAIRFLLIDLYIENRVFYS